MAGFRFVMPETIKVNDLLNDIATARCATCNHDIDAELDTNGKVWISCEGGCDDGWVDRGGVVNAIKVW